MTVYNHFVGNANLKTRIGATTVKKYIKPMSVTVVAMFTTQNQKLLNHQCLVTSVARLLIVSEGLTAT
jgi:hypothetical protein